MRKISTVLTVYILMILLIGCAKNKLSLNSDNPDDIGKNEATISDEKLRVSEFTLGPGDEVEITVWGVDEMGRKLLIGPTGFISYPFVGDIQANGISIFQLRDRIANGLSDYFLNPKVSVNISSSHSKKIYVLGEVVRPGIFQMTGTNSLIEAISMAGGFTQDAKEQNILLVRGGLVTPVLRSLDLKAALRKGDLSQNILLKAGDIVYIPSSTFADTERFFKRIASIISPIVNLETGIVLEPTVENVFHGQDVGNIVVIPSK